MHSKPATKSTNVTQQCELRVDSEPEVQIGESFSYVAMPYMAWHRRMIEEM
jgi:hypothetical protein